MTVSERKRCANQRNAARSTGPRTAEGKARSRHNAIRHGVFAADVVLPGEDRETFAVLRRDALDSLRPQDALQLSVVERIVSATWRLQRLREVYRWLHEGRLVVLREEMLEGARGEADRAATLHTIAALPGAVATALLIQNEVDPLERLARHEQRLELSIQRSLRQLRELQDPKVPRPAACAFDSDLSNAPEPLPWAAGEGSGDGENTKCENEPTADGVWRNSAVTDRPATPAATIARTAAANSPAG